MPALSEMEGTTLLAEGGEAVGEVERVLFHPSEPRAVAVMVKRSAALGVVARAPAFVAWGDVAVGPDVACMRIKRLPSRSSVEKSLGLDMDATVIWRGMPVAGVGGGRIGTVGDASLADDGTVTTLSVSTGAVGDIAHGRAHVAGDAVRGFDGASVVIEARSEDLETDGGLAASAAKGAAAVKSAASDGAKAAEGALLGASYATGRALATAARSQPARKARSALKGLADAFREGRDGE